MKQQSLSEKPEPRHGGLGVFLRGMLMGAADIVPGVSGGTMAFITGIYQRLIAAISAFDVSTLLQLMRGQWKEAWLTVDGNFLLALVAGIGVSVFSLARVITHLLESQPLFVWAFFFGLILASAVILVRHVGRWSMPAILGLAGGALVAVLIGLSPALTLSATPVAFFVAGFIAICAMILPGVSGSFILVLLGMYEPVLGAIEAFDLLSLALVAAGAGCGLLVFTRILNFLLLRFHAPTLATLTGFLLGSLPVVWPWRLVDEVSGALQPVLPSSYAETMGSHGLLPCLLLMVTGILAVWLLENQWGGLER